VAASTSAIIIIIIIIFFFFFFFFFFWFLLYSFFKREDKPRHALRGSRGGLWSGYSNQTDHRSCSITSWG
jgi:hypothetical protein